MPHAVIAKLLHESMGLHSATVGANTINQAITARMRVCNVPTPADYLTVIMHSRTELDALIEAVVVPETWFFRDHNPFVAFSNWVNENRENFTCVSPLQILSLPCSSGEEPYTLSMCLSDCTIALDKAQIDAFDISQKNLEKAKTAIYGNNSFRGDNLLYRDRHFSPVGSNFRVNDEIIKRVRFQRGNLLDIEFTSAREKYGVIFCRNLLIYFDRATQHLAIDRLSDALLPNGLLFVGHSETSLLKGRPFSALEHSRCFGFRKEASRPTRESDAPSKFTAHARSAGRSSPQPIRARPIPPFVPSQDPKQTTQNAPANPAANPIQKAFRLANEGHLNEAAELCESLIKQRDNQADAHYLLGVVREAAGNINEAQQLFRKAVYLDPGHAEALTHLSILASRTGDEQGAQRFRDRAVRAQSTGNPRQVKE